MVLTLNTQKLSSNYCIVKHPQPIIYEKKKGYMKHDQLFKELIGNFFEEFLEAFFQSFMQILNLDQSDLCQKNCLLI